LRIYVGNLPYAARKEELEPLFVPYGELTSAEVIVDPATGRSRGFGFFEMADGDAQRAIEALDGTDFAGRTLGVSEATGRTDPATDQAGSASTPDSEISRGRSKKFGTRRGVIPSSRIVRQVASLLEAAGSAAADGAWDDVRLIVAGVVSLVPQSRDGAVPAPLGCAACGAGTVETLRVCTACGAEESAEPPLDDLVPESNTQTRTLAQPATAGTPSAAGNPWSPEEDERLREAVTRGVPTKQLAVEFKRTCGAIKSRIGKLGLDDPRSEAAKPELPSEASPAGPRGLIPETASDVTEPSPEPLYKQHGTKTPRMQGPYGKGLKFHT